MVQKAATGASWRPSISNEPWLYARAHSKCHFDIVEEHVGKWLIFLSPADVDFTWDKIKSGIESNGLDHSSCGAKGSTAASRQKGKHVIVVYTSDYRDKKGVEYCLSQLRELGVRGRIFYKADEQTLAGQYSGGGVKAHMYSSDDFES